jgi:hypothetical protein
MGEVAYADKAWVVDVMPGSTSGGNRQSVLEKLDLLGILHPHTSFADLNPKRHNHYMVRSLDDAIIRRYETWSCYGGSHVVQFLRFWTERREL